VASIAEILGALDKFQGDFARFVESTNARLDELETASRNLASSIENAASYDETSVALTKINEQLGELREKYSDVVSLLLPMAILTLW